MKDLKMDTDAVAQAAEEIRKFNRENREAFKEVAKAMNKLDKYWDGAAAAGAMSKFSEIRGTYIDDQINVLENFANFLTQQVGLGYVNTEEVNTSLADAFR